MAAMLTKNRQRNNLLEYALLLAYVCVFGFCGAVYFCRW